MSDQWREAGPYNFWSSAWGEGLAGVVKVAILFLLLRPLYQRAMRHLECHVDGCTHIDFPVHGTGYRACHQEGHHPGIAHESGEAVTAEHIARAHAKSGR